MRGTDEREDSVNWVRVRPGFKFTNKLQIEQFQHFERAWRQKVSPLCDFNFFPLLLQLLWEQVKRARRAFNIAKQICFSELCFFSFFNFIFNNCNHIQDDVRVRRLLPWLPARRP